MSIVHFLVFKADSEIGKKLKNWFNQEPIEILKSIEGVERVDIYIPKVSTDPHLDDGVGPIMTVQTCYADIETLESALSSSELSRLLIHEFPKKFPACQVQHDAMEMQFYPVANDSFPKVWEAPVSYVVRYHHPVEDQESFIKFYMENHLPLLKKLPDILNLICYMPINWSDSLQLKRINYLLGNEVVFSTKKALNNALSSPLREKMREDYRCFPLHGPVTHFAMSRKQVL